VAQANTVIPNFMLRPLYENSREPLFQGKNTFLYITSIGCKYCTAFEENALSDLLSLIEEVDDKLDFVVFAYGQTLDEIREHYAGSSMRILLGNDEFTDTLDLDGVPTFYLVSPEGKVKWTMLGFGLEEDVSSFDPIWSLLD